MKNTSSYTIYCLWITKYHVESILQKKFNLVRKNKKPIVRNTDLVNVNKWHLGIKN